MIGSSKSNPAQDRSADALLLVAGSHTLYVQTEPSWRKVAGLTYTDLPFLDCLHLAIHNASGAIWTAPEKFILDPLSSKRADSLPRQATLDRRPAS